MTGRALVLGGGGVTGIAWEWGVLAGLAALGVDLTSADVVIGTSAGSVVGARLATGTVPEEGYAAQLGDPGKEVAVGLGRADLLRYVRAVAGSRTPERVGARLGRMALASSTVPEATRREIIAARLPDHSWPGRPLLITAVDASSGERIVFDRLSNVPLVDAVAASCAVPGVWPPVTIDGRRYIDGGVRSAANVDLAGDYAQVVVLAPITSGFGPCPSPLKQAGALERSGTRVTVVSPSREARRAIGPQTLDPTRRAPAAEAGRDQAPQAASAVTAIWT